MRVANPTFVTRVGYPKCIEDFVPSAQKGLFAAGLLRPKTSEFNRFEKGLINSYAALLLKEAHFGGNDRTLHTIELPEFKDSIVEVVDTKVAKTGRRYGGYGGSSWNCYDDAEGPSFDATGTHILVAVWPDYNTVRPRPGTNDSHFHQLYGFWTQKPFDKKRWSIDRRQDLVIELSNLAVIE